MYFSRFLENISNTNRDTFLEYFIPVLLSSIHSHKDIHMFFLPNSERDFNLFLACFNFVSMQEYLTLQAESTETGAVGKF